MYNAKTLQKHHQYPSIHPSIHPSLFVQKFQHDTSQFHKAIRIRAGRKGHYFNTDIRS